MERLAKTRKRLWDFVIAGMILWSIGSMYLWIPHTGKWLILMSVITACGLALIYLARRGVWISYWAVLTFGGLATLGVTVVYLALENIPIQMRLWSMGAMGIVILVGVVAYVILWTVPRWKAAFPVNIQRKLDLKHGLYSVTRHWADPPGTRVGSTSAFYPWLLTAGPTFVAAARLLDVDIRNPIVLVGMYVVWFSWSMMASELYVAHQLRKIERQIGRPLLIDAYVDDAPMKAR